MQKSGKVNLPDQKQNKKGQKHGYPRGL